jgi:hypothetical protein
MLASDIAAALGLVGLGGERTLMRKQAMHWIDPAYLPETKGTFARFLINSRGVANGLLLKDGKEIHFPPHMAEAVVASLKSGGAVKVRGVRPRHADMIVAFSIQAGDAAPIVEVRALTEERDEAKREDETSEKAAKPEPAKSADTEGVIAHVLHGPRGEKRGALLDNGVIVRLPPHVAEALRE